ncbi:MAG: permease-like cell division protein FtsX [Methylococcaceae bacterium]|nr:permease-like cell division protein FtsX [Methylococcaceae bacterium]
MALKGKSTFRRGLFRQPIQSAEKLSDRVKAHWNLQSDSLRESFRRMWQTPIASTLTILVVAIALALPASFNALIQNARQPIEALESTSQISLFLKPELSNEAGRKLALKLNKHPALAGATLITKEDGLKELAAYSGFGDALAALNSNPLPAVVIVHPVETDADAVTRLLAELKTLPEADRVQFDSEWLEKLRALLAIAGRCAAAFSVLLGFGVLFIVGNTIRLELQNRREEIAVAKMLGATHRFIRRPFVHAGLWYALLGAILAWLLANLLILGVRSPANQLAELYGSPFRLSYLGLADTAILLASAVLLGIIGAWVVVAHFLREIDPD